MAMLEVVYGYRTCDSCLEEGVGEVGEADDGEEKAEGNVSSS